MPPAVHRLSAPALLVALLIALCSGAALAIPAARVDFSPVGGCGPNNLEGWEFQTTAAISVSALGVFDSYADGLQFAVPVGLYDSTCALLASVTIPAGTIAPLHGGYRYAAITPLTLPSGQTFRIAAVMHCDDYTASIQNLDDVSLDAAVSYVRTRRNGFEDMLTCPTETTSGNSFDFTPNFQIGPPCGNGVIEPGEQCDDANAIDDDCCSLECKPALEGVPCPDDGLACTADLCDDAGICTHAPGNAGTECSPAEDDCHLPDRCDGESEECPELDERKDVGEPCTDDGLFCTGAEVCGEVACTSSGDPCGGAICDEDLDQCITATPTITQTPPATATRTASPMASETPVATPTEPSAACAGDCDGDGSVAINELITGVGIALDSQGLGVCPSFDPSGNGEVEINELIASVNAALNGCG
jgi:cysteine-rich repeat protein